MKNSYQKFLESFLDEFSKTNSINSVTEKTDDLFAEIVERQSTSIFSSNRRAEDGSRELANPQDFDEKKPAQN